MSTAALKNDFRAAVSRLEGKRCWSVLAGSGTGSHFILDLGEKVPRDYRIENPTLTVVQRTFRGELSLFVECAWRLDSKSSVICGWGDSNGPNGDLVRGLQLSCGRRVTRVSLRHPAQDLEGCFGDLVLRVFCDQTSPLSHGSNYSIDSWRSPRPSLWKGLKFVVEARGRTHKERITRVRSKRNPVRSLPRG